jgi:DNA modification methylase
LKESIKMTVKKEHLQMGLEKLVKNPENAKLHRDDLIEKSIQEVGYIDDIVVDEANMVMSGHGRLNALEKLGHKKVDVIKVSGLTKEQKEKYILLANKSVEAGGWDFESLKKKDWDLLQYAGFESEELEAVFGIEVDEDDFKPPETGESAPVVTAKRGDVYQLDRHKLMCGDSTCLSDMEKLMDGKKARLIFTDPPYNVDYKSRANNSYDEGKYGHIKNFDDNKTEKDCLQFYTDVLKNLYTVTTDDACIYWWYAQINIHINRQAFIDAGWRIHQDVIWVKESPVLTRRDYMGLYEPCLYGWKSGKKHYSHRLIRNIRDIWNLNFEDFVSLMDVWYEKRDNINEYVHPTQKPVRLSERALKLSSQKGDIVMDVFGGSGSTLMGCEQVDRICYMCELDPFYVDVIVRRYEEFTGKKGKLING